jgi:hypothetical protein
MSSRSEWRFTHVCVGKCGEHIIYIFIRRYPTIGSNSLFASECSCAWQLVQCKTNATRIRAINLECRQGAHSSLSQWIAHNSIWSRRRRSTVIAELVNNFTQRHALPRHRTCVADCVFWSSRCRRRFREGRRETNQYPARFDFCHF